MAGLLSVAALLSVAIGQQQGMVISFVGYSKSQSTVIQPGYDTLKF